METVDILYETLTKLQEQMSGMDQRYKKYNHLREVWHNVYEIYHVEFQKEVSKRKKVVA